MTWTEATAKFAKNLRGYEPREAQTRLATSIEDALNSGVHLMAQAGCGTGKSFAGLVPAIDYAKSTGLPVVIATATKALQDQYANKDLPALHAMLGGNFRFAVVKGRSNYVCRAKLAELDSTKLSVDREVLNKALDDDDATGDFDQLPVTLDYRDRAALSTSSEECPGKADCPFGAVCLAEKAKARAKDAQIVVANHALLVTDASLKSMSEGKGAALLPEYSAVLVDEAHELPEYTTNTLGSEVSERSLTRLATDVAAFAEDRSLLADTVKPFSALFAVLEEALGKDSTRPMDANLLVKVGREIQDVLAQLDALNSSLRDIKIWGDDQKSQQKKRLRKRVTNTADKIRNIILADFGDLVRWIERTTVRPRNGEPYTQILLRYAPLSVADFLRTNIWDNVPATLMSATLAVGTDFSLLTSQLGLDGSEHFDVGTPFDFTEQARLYVPKIPDPTRDAGGYRAGVTMNLIELVRAADGRALLLFTSWTGLNQAYQALSPVLASMGHRALKQGELSNRELAQTFAEDEHSVLFAVKSFFTGVDIQGDALRLVVIDKLPFAVPTDVIFKARCDVLDAQARNKWVDGSFPKLSVPTMALTLLQGFGRLIRTKQDRGLVAILDPRLLTKSYGKVILGALPNAPLLTELSEATDYLRSLDEVPVA